MGKLRLRGVDTLVSMRMSGPRGCRALGRLLLQPQLPPGYSATNRDTSSPCGSFLPTIALHVGPNNPISASPEPCWSRPPAQEAEGGVALGAGLPCSPLPLLQQDQAADSVEGPSLPAPAPTGPWKPAYIFRSTTVEVYFNL